MNLRLYCQFLVRKKGFFILFLSVFSFFLYSCEETPPERIPTLNERMGYDKDIFMLQIESCLNQEQSNIFHDSVTAAERDSIISFYRSRHFTPALLFSFEDTSLFNFLLTSLKGAGSHGLKPEEYNTLKISAFFENAFSRDSLPPDERHKFLALAELSMASGLAKYVSHLRYGRLNPKNIFDSDYAIPVIDSADRVFLEPLQSDNIKELLQQTEFRDERYNSLRMAVPYYAELKTHEWKKIPYFSRKMKAGDRDSDFPLIAERLNQLDFFDTTGIDIRSQVIYDSNLVKALTQFQEERGLVPDGIPGKSTIDWLNVTPDEYLQKIYLSLERYRWTTYTDSSDYLLVNIPAFTVYMHEGGTVSGEIKVCTGKKRSKYYQDQLDRYKKTLKLKHKPEDWETPQLYAEISHVVLNPTWTVPPSIIREELYSEYRKDTTYLVRKKFKVYRDNEEMDISQIDLRNYDPENIPYSFVQSPDPFNALGKLKFIFQNRFGVYLHDTPTRAPFGYANRAVSHGCVRVEKPYMLAEYLLRNHSKWNLDYVKIETGVKVADKDIVKEYYQNRKQLRQVDNKEKTTTVKLDKKVILFIDYYTAWVDQNGKVQFREDVYNKDLILSGALFNPAGVQS